MSAKLPVFYGVTRTFEDNGIRDVTGEVRERFAAMFAQDRPELKGKSVAVCVGSRGIASLPELVRATLECLKDMGMAPFIVPSMGSHGGATAQGQIDLLASLGVTEESMGAPIVSDMEVTELYPIPDGPTVRFSTTGLKADYVVPVCRVKPHTILTGEVQSGLCKMIVIGCGKHEGAKDYHRHDIEKVLVLSAEKVIEKVSLLCGVAVVENSKDDICELRVVPASEFIETDKALLRLAQGYLPRVPIPKLHTLIIDEIGKDISGGGADLNVIGTWRRDGGPRVPDFHFQVLLGLTEATHGNAIGIGYMDFIPKRLLEQIDYQAGFINAMTAGTPRSVRTPMWLEDDRAIMEAILSTIPEGAPAPMARIRNTRDLGRFWVTEHAIPLIQPGTGCVVDEKVQEPQFDHEGRWLPFS